MEWREIGWCESVYVGPDGRIVGKCESTFRTWNASYERKTLGEYIDEASAKTAVENEWRNHAECLEKVGKITAADIERCRL
jgi:hypothetical protein